MILTTVMAMVIWKLDEVQKRWLLFLNSKRIRALLLDVYALLKKNIPWRFRAER
jgi:hypothetical protein